LVPSLGQLVTSHGLGITSVASYFPVPATHQNNSVFEDPEQTKRSLRSEKMHQRFERIMKDQKALHQASGLID
jgi:hypothetical protein